MHHPSTGSHVSYAREFIGHRLAHGTGRHTGVGEGRAVAIYLQYWGPHLDGRIAALIAWLMLVGSSPADSAHRATLP
ncbi:MAG TPA: hypothetical protein DCR15_02970 [Arthrobacter bacterium]|jgi:L-asparagine transporter-like permease|nr:hypothetical protein [Arthrobacter sp.]HBH57459.1 hypothetical protein [Arthrobacter sp.]